MVEAVGKALEALKGNPFVLGLVLVNAVFLIGGGLMLRDIVGKSSESNIRRDALLVQFAEMVKTCRDK